MDTFTKIMLLLKQKKLTQKDLTDHLGLSKSVFTDWKSGKNTLIMYIHTHMVI